MEIKLKFPYPDSVLFPNRKSSWQSKMLATRKARWDAYLLGVAQGGRKDEPLDNVTLEIIWHPSSKKIPDYDSLLRATSPIINGGLINARFLKDDSPKVIKKVTLSIGDISKEPYTEVIINEV